MFANARFCPQPRRGDGCKKYVIDQFESSEFFESGGLLLRDYEVFARADVDSVLREKIQSQMVENDVKSFDPSTDDEDILQQLVSKYDNGLGVLERVKSAIASVRKKEYEDKHKQPES